MWPDATQTHELLEQAKNGDADAVDRLLAKHREPIRRMIDMRIDPAIVQRVDASDVVQEVLIEASRRLKDYLKSPAMPFHLWLRHIAKDHSSTPIAGIIRPRSAASIVNSRSIARRVAEHSSLELAAQLLDQDLTPASAAIQAEMQRRLPRRSPSSTRTTAR